MQIFSVDISSLNLRFLVDITRYLVDKNAHFAPFLVDIAKWLVDTLASQLQTP